MEKPNDTIKVKIVSDGTTEGTKITDAESGREIKNVTSVKIKIDAATGFPTATLTIFGPELYLSGVKTEVVKTKLALVEES